MLSVDSTHKHTATCTHACGASKTRRLSKSTQQSRTNLLSRSHKYNSGTINKLTGVK